MKNTQKSMKYVKNAFSFIQWTNLSAVDAFGRIKSEHFLKHVDSMIVGGDEDIGQGYAGARFECHVVGEWRDTRPVFLRGRS